MNPLLLRYLPHLIAIGAILGGLYAIHHHGFNKGEHYVQSKWDKERTSNLEAQAKRNAEDSAKLHELETAKNENLATIDRLTRSNRNLKRLRISQSYCPSKADPDNPAGGGKFHEELHGGAGEVVENAVNEFDLTYRAEAERADKLIEGCRVINDYLN